ncbi:50S ribosomal protein L9 [bacterium]|nr:50S ribosomal protein L9 [bacterium]MCI0565856.1 50S ribosomal protein L9 [bacterium]
MQIILLNDVPKVGKKFESIAVKNGFARNFLIPKGLARLATADALKNIEAMREKARLMRESRDAELLKKAGEIEKAKITIIAPANAKGALFAGLHKGEIREAFEKQTGIAIPGDIIVLETPIKETGEHRISVAIGDTKTSFILNVEKEKKEKAKKEEKI